MIKYTQRRSHCLNFCEFHGMDAEKMLILKISDPFWLFNKIIPIIKNWLAEIAWVSLLYNLIYCGIALPCSIKLRSASMIRPSAFVCLTSFMSWPHSLNVFGTRFLLPSAVLKHIISVLSGWQFIIILFFLTQFSANFSTSCTFSIHCGVDSPVTFMLRQKNFSLKKIEH